MNKYKPAHWRGGQSILEVVVALAIFALIASSFVSLTLGSFAALDSSSDQLTAAALADEGLEAVRSVRDGAWNELIYNQSAVSSSTGAWRLAGEGSSETIGPFTRTITFTPVGIPVDLYSKDVKSKVDWTTTLGGAASIAREARLTNWDSRDWIQTDWSGGGGQNVWSNPILYASDDGKVDITTVGELKLKALPSAWNQVPSTVTAQLNDIFCIADNDCWAVGNAASGELLLHWDGAWSRLIPLAGIPNVNLNTIHCSSSTNCFAAGASGVIIRWDGNNWSLPPSGGWDTGNQTWNDVWAFDANSGFVVGAAGEIWRLSGGTWTRSQDTGSQTWNTIWMLNATNGFVAGSAGEIRRYNGFAWLLSQDTGGQTWNDIQMFGPSSGIVIGTGGVVRKYDGVNWSGNDGTGFTGTWNALYMFSPTSGWSVGNNSTYELIYERTSSGWSRLSSNPSLPNVNLFSVFCIAANNCWAVGASGVILHFTGGGFETSGVLISSVFDMSPLAGGHPVQIIEWDEQIPVCVPPAACNIKFKIRVADNPAMAGAAWSSDFTAAAGTLIDPSYNGRRYVQYETTLSGDGASTPVLNEIRINYK